jgi:hypothetical protein
MRKLYSFSQSEIEEFFIIRCDDIEKMCNKKYDNKPVGAMHGGRQSAIPPYLNTTFKGATLISIQACYQINFGIAEQI